MTLIRIILAVLSLSLAVPGQAAPGDPIPVGPTPAGDQTIEDFLWTARPLVIFADTPEDPEFIRQMALLLGGLAELEQRGVVILTDTDPASASALRKKLRPHGFALVLVGLDGRVHLRKPAPWDVREITRAIDRIRE